MSVGITLYRRQLQRLVGGVGITIYRRMVRRLQAYTDYNVVGILGCGIVEAPRGTVRVINTR
jgi:hypothetical protein